MLRAEIDKGPGSAKFSVRELSAWFGDERVLHGINLDIAQQHATAVIGPSGCGKSTFIRCLNRMHELVPAARIQGEIRLDGVDVYERRIDPVLLRRRVGMVFQKPNPFPSMSVRENVLAGLRLTGSAPPSAATQHEVVEHALSQAALWDEVKDRLDDPGVGLSSGQQQRLCIARALAVNPDVLLMDEPCSALDPIATAKIEDLIHSLKQSYTIVVVTHSMQQAARVSDRTGFFLAGELIEFDTTDRIFTSPRDSRTEDYITGKFG
jgi:phosphate transport system ATP-binding protein